MSERETNIIEDMEREIDELNSQKKEVRAIEKTNYKINDYEKVAIPTTHKVNKRINVVEKNDIPKGYKIL